MDRIQGGSRPRGRWDRNQEAGKTQLEERHGVTGAWDSCERTVLQLLTQGFLSTGQQALLRCAPYTIKLTALKGTVQWFLAYPGLYTIPLFCKWRKEQ